MGSCVWMPPPLYTRSRNFGCPFRFSQPYHLPRSPLTFIDDLCSARGTSKLRSSSEPNDQTETVRIQLYRDIDRELPQLTYRLFLERLADRYFDIHKVLFEERIRTTGRVRIPFNKEASITIPLLSPVLVPMAQSIGPFLSQIASSPTIRFEAEMTRKQFEYLCPAIFWSKFFLWLSSFLHCTWTWLKIRFYYGISRNLLIKFKDDTIDETSVLAQVLCSDSAISSSLDMSIRLLPGDHGLPLQQAPFDVPPAMADAVNRSGEFLATLTAGTPWESVAKEVGNTFSTDLRCENSRESDGLVDVITTWIACNPTPTRLFRR